MSMSERMMVILNPGSYGAYHVVGETDNLSTSMISVKIQFCWAVFYSNLLNKKTAIVLQESSTASSREKPGKLEAQSSNFLFPKACHQRARSNSTSKCLPNTSSGTGFSCSWIAGISGGGWNSSGPGGLNWHWSLLTFFMVCACSG